MVFVYLSKGPCLYQAAQNQKMSVWPLHIFNGSCVELKTINKEREYSQLGICRIYQTWAPYNGKYLEISWHFIID